MEVRFSGTAGVLEGYLHLPEGNGPFPGVVVCHPHPRMGGDMRNSVVMGICSSLAKVGISSLRFNFRGVGESQGVYDDGRGEVDDALAALGCLASCEAVAEGSIGLAGYSFGAGIAMKAALRDDLTRAVSMVARPRVDPEDEVGERPSLPMLFVVGGRDRLMPTDLLNELAAKLTTPPEVHVVPEADHFFGGQELQVGGVVAAFFQRWLTPSL
ncbi:MAG: dienelactone hydrolase [Dehalococcoidia bacterium]|nr:dienelactone hydrolase [Dehalococcoidia bacterium]